MRRRLLSLLALASLLVVGVLAAAPILHEYFDPTDAAPSPKPSPAAGGEPSAAGPGDVPVSVSSQPGDPDRYRLDADTSRPERVGYDDPFTPSIPPFKRLFAFDTVNTAIELVVDDTRLRRLHVGGQAKNSDDQFYGDIELSLNGDEPVRIPSVGPSARVLGAKLVPAAEFTLLADGAENWFLRSAARGSHRLIVHLAIERAVFGSPFADVSWEALVPHLPSLPAVVTPPAREVLDQLKLHQGLTPKVAVEQLVRYFRSFTPSDDQLGLAGAELYTAIALGQKGVCRHRAFAFVVSALSLGIPSRFVSNEAHAWVEIHDSVRWHRVDLGGAAGDVEFGRELELGHVAPQDPHPWPANSESGRDMVRRATSGGASGAADRSPPAASQPNADTEPAPTNTTSPSAAPSAPPSAEPTSSTAPTSSPTPTATDSTTDDPEAAEALEPELSEPELPPRQAARVEFTWLGGSGQVLRGGRLSVIGRVHQEGRGCALQRVDVMVRDALARSHRVGALVTAHDGRFQGDLVMPETIPVGDYQLFVQSAGDATCAPSHSLDAR